MPLPEQFRGKGEVSRAQPFTGGGRATEEKPAAPDGRFPLHLLSECRHFPNFSVVMILMDDNLRRRRSRGAKVTKSEGRQGKRKCVNV